MPEPGGRVGDSDRVALTFLGVLGLPALLGSAAVWWGNGTRWLIARGILLGADEHPLWPIPGLAGAGLDFSRAAVVAAVVAGLLAVAVSALRRAWLVRRQVTGP